MKNVPVDGKFAPDGWLPIRVGDAFVGDWMWTVSGPIEATMEHDGPLVILKRDEPASIRTLKAIRRHIDNRPSDAVIHKGSLLHDQICSAIRDFEKGGA